MNVIKKIFISGKITGCPILETIKKFEKAESILRSKYEVIEIVNPLWLKGMYFDISHIEAMKICIEAMKECDAIYLLEDWEKSAGSKFEYSVARAYNMKIIIESKSTRSGQLPYDLSNIKDITTEPVYVVDKEAKAFVIEVRNIWIQDARRADAILKNPTAHFGGLVLNEPTIDLDRIQMEITATSCLGSRNKYRCSNIHEYDYIAEEMKKIYKEVTKSVN